MRGMDMSASGPTRYIPLSMQPRKHEDDMKKAFLLVLLREVFASSWLRGSIWEPGAGESRVGWRAGRILFEIEYASGHALAFARSEIGRGEGDVDRREQAAERPRRHRLLHPLVAFAFLFTLHAPLALGQRPPDVDL